MEKTGREDVGENAAAGLEAGWEDRGGRVEDGGGSVGGWCGRMKEAGWKDGGSRQGGRMKEAERENG